MVELARRRLRQKSAPECYCLLAEAAWISWQRGLLKRLLSAGNDALLTEWKRFRARRKISARGEATANYRAFVQTHLQDGFSEFFLRYPVLARLWSILTKNWINFVRRVLGRLHRDWAILHTQLLPTLPRQPKAGVVADMAAGLSDPHNGGATVLALIFQNGERMIYKPRDLRVDRTYFRFLKELNDAAQATRSFRIPKFGARPQGRYGWMEFIAQAPCRRRDGPRDFYWQIGALTCLHFLLRAVDGHARNWVAAGEQPVCIDLETLWHPTFGGGPSVRNTVARTGILPLRGYAYPVVGGRMAGRTALRVPGWKQVNTDRMRCVWRHVPIRRQMHIPQTCGRRWARLTVARAESMLAGFSEMTDRLSSDPTARSALRRCLVALQKPGAALHRRWLVRTTITYDALLQRARRAACLRDGSRRHRLLATLRPDRRALKPRSLQEAELRALESLDIPRFQAADCADRLSRKAAAWPQEKAAMPQATLKHRLRRQLPLLARLLSKAS